MFVAEILLAGWTTHRRNLRVARDHGMTCRRKPPPNEVCLRTVPSALGDPARGSGLLALSWWMARRDARFADRPKLVWLLFALRCVAVLVLLWMLAGPTLVTDRAQIQNEIRRGVRGHFGEHGTGRPARWLRQRQPLGRGPRTDDRAGPATSRTRWSRRACSARPRTHLRRFSKLSNAPKNLEAPRRALALGLSGLKTGVGRRESAIDPICRDSGA